MDYASRFFTKAMRLWKQGDEDENWSRKGNEVILKKLKKEKGPGIIQDLQWILENKTPNSRCVTIAKSKDGRLQVSHRKGLPHVICCRIWRWPDLQSYHELRSDSQHCQNPFIHNSNQREICINPYHYQRLVLPVV